MNRELNPLLQFIIAICLTGSVCNQVSPQSSTVVEGHSRVSLGYYQSTDEAKQTFELKGHRGSIESLAVSPDGRTLASSGGKSVRLWSLASGDLVATLPANRNWDLLFSPDGKLLATWSYSKTIQLWNVKDGTLNTTIVNKKGFTSSLAFSPDSRIMYTSSLQELVVRVWDVASGQLIATLPHKEDCDHCGVGIRLALSPDGSTIATATFQRIYLWDTSTLKLRSALNDPRYTQVLRDSRGEVTNYLSHGQTIYTIAFSPDGKSLATGSRDGTAKLWDTTTGQLAHTLLTRWPAQRIAFSPDNKVLATGGGKCELWDVQTGKLISSFQKSGTVWSIGFSPDSKMVSCGADTKPSVGIWGVSSGNLISSPDQARFPLVFRDDRTLITGSSHGTVLVWDIAR